MVRLLNGASSKVYLSINTDASGNAKTITLNDSGGGHLIVNAASITSTFTMGAWNYIEFAYKVAASGGGGQVWVNGTSIGSLFTYDSSANAGINKFQLGNDAFGTGLDNGDTAYFDDVKISTSGPIGIYPDNIWQTTLNTKPNQVFFNGTWGQPVTSVGAITQANNWYWTANTLSAYSTSNPTTAFTSPGIEAGARDNNVVISGKNYITINNLDVRDANSSGISVSGVSSNFTAQNNTAEYNFHSGIEAASSGEWDNALIDSNVIHDNGASGVRWNGAFNGGAISHNTVYHNSLFKPDATNGNDAFLQYSGGIISYGTNASNLTIDSNYVYNNGLLSATVTDFTQGMGIWPDTAGTGYVIKNNLVKNNYSNGIQVEKTSNAQVYNNVLINNATAQYTANLVLQAGDETGKITNNNLIYNNTMYGGWWGLALNNLAGANTMSNNLIKNNISYGTGTGLLYLNAGAANNGADSIGNVIDHNSFGTAASCFIVYGSCDNTYSSFETAYGMKHKLLVNK